MHPIHEEKQLLEYPFVIAGRHPMTHFFGFYGLLLERFDGFPYAIWFGDFSEPFLENYHGHIICLAPHYAEELFHRNRGYKIILISHGPIPMSWRAPEIIYADHLIDNGSPTLMKRIDFSHVKQVCTAGYFPTDYFSGKRTEGLALVQMTTHSSDRTWQDQCCFTLSGVCDVLLKKGFEVCVYSHVMHPSDLAGLPAEIRVVRPGTDYVYTLSSCTHFVFTGTSGFITNMYQPGCHMTAISCDWIGKNSTLFQEILHDCCYVAQSQKELTQCLSLSAKGDEKITKFLYGEDRRNVIRKINQYLQSLL